MKNETLALIVLVYRANSSKEKVEIIQQARERSAGTPSLPTGTPSLRDRDSVPIDHTKPPIAHVNVNIGI